MLESGCHMSRGAYLVLPEIVVHLLPLRDVVLEVGPEDHHHGERDVGVDDAAICGTRSE